MTPTGAIHVGELLPQPFKAAFWQILLPCFQAVATEGPDRRHFVHMVLRLVNPRPIPVKHCIDSTLEIEVFSKRRLQLVVRRKSQLYLYCRPVLEYAIVHSRVKMASEQVGNVAGKGTFQEQFLSLSRHLTLFHADR